MHRAVAQRTGLLLFFRARPRLADDGLQRGFEGSIKSFLRSGLRGEKICHRSHKRAKLFVQAGNGGAVAKAVGQGLQVGSAKPKAAPKRDGLTLAHFKGARRVKLVHKGRYGVECLLCVALQHHGLNIGIQNAGWVDLFKQRGDVGLVLISENRDVAAALNAGSYLREGCAVRHFCQGRKLGKAFRRSASLDELVVHILHFLLGKTDFVQRVGDAVAGVARIRALHLRGSSGGGRERSTGLGF